RAARSAVETLLDTAQHGFRVERRRPRVQGKDLLEGHFAPFGYVDISKLVADRFESQLPCRPQDARSAAGQRPEQPRRAPQYRRGGGERAAGAGLWGLGPAGGGGAGPPHGLIERVPRTAAC